MDSHTIWMIVSVVIGGGCFVIIHFTKWLRTPIYFAILQMPANAFVVVSWGSAFLAWQGLEKLFAFGGIVVPFIMATITIRKVVRARRQT